MRCTIILLGALFLCITPLHFMIERVQFDRPRIDDNKDKSPTQGIQIVGLIDHWLCNNDDSHFHYPENCFTQAGHSRRCDTRQIAAEECTEALIDMNQLNYLFLLCNMASLAENSLICRITVRFHLANDSLIRMCETVGPEIDKFLTPRPW